VLEEGQLFRKADFRECIIRPHLRVVYTIEQSLHPTP
jgi:hypothetical protein